MPPYTILEIESPDLFTLLFILMGYVQE